MDVPLKDEDQAFVDRLVAEGRYGSAEDAVHDGLRMLRHREEKLAALRATIQRSIERGGSLTDEEVAASIEATLDQIERETHQPA